MPVSHLSQLIYETKEDLKQTGLTAAVIGEYCVRPSGDALDLPSLQGMSAMGTSIPSCCFETMRSLLLSEMQSTESPGAPSHLTGLVRPCYSFCAF